MRFLDRRDWVYLLSLLVPLVAYDLALKVVGLASEQQDSGVWDALGLLRSELLFDGGYVLVWIGLFAVARRGIPRGAVLVLLHISAILLVVVATVAYQYFRSTGTVLDYGVVAYYLADPGEARGAVSSDAPVGAWLVLSAALLYVLPGPLLLTRALLPAGASGRSTGRPTDDGGQDPPGRGRTPRRALTRQEFLAAGAGAAGAILLGESLSPDLHLNELDEVLGFKHCEPCVVGVSQLPERWSPDRDALGEHDCGGEQRPPHVSEFFDVTKRLHCT